MNTPEPCNICDKLYWNVLHEEDSSYMAECILDKKMGDKECSEFSCQQQEYR